MKKLVADTTKCMGNGVCVLTAPQLFSQNQDDGLVQVIKPLIGAEDVAAAELAVHSCPTQALKIVDASE